MFNSPTFQDYYLRVPKMVSERLQKESPEYLVQVDFQQFLEHLVDEYMWDVLEWDESGLTIDPFVGKQRITDYGEVVEVDRPCVRLRLPFQPHPQRERFLELMPSSQRSSGEPDWRFEGNTLVFEAGADEQAIQRALDGVRFWIGGRNTDVRNGNAMLRQAIEPIWKRKREELEKHFGTLKALTERLKIPLHQDPQAPKPVVVTKPRAVRTKPTLPPAIAEPQLERASVLEIVGFVETYARQLEVTPGVYSKLDEEQLRDLVLSMLNVNYPGSSGETFSKQGKTDLFLRAEGGGSLIVECKRWSGPKHYGDSLDQLFRYLTWRHSYGVLLTFCTNRDMTACIIASTKVVEGHTTTVGGSVRRVSSHFSSRHVHPQDRAKEVELFHLFVDLSVPGGG